MNKQDIVMLTNPIDPLGEKILKDAGLAITLAPDQKPESLYRLAVDADAIVVRTHLPVDIFDRSPRVRAVVRHGVGLDMIPMDRADSLGIPVANVPGANSEAVAEYAIAAMLHFLRPIAWMDREHRTKDWGTARRRADSTGEIWGKTLGIVGVGGIGARLAEIARGAFGMRVMGHQRHLDRLPGFVEGATRERLFAESDIVVLSCPLTAETRHMVNAELLARIKPSAFLINVARGPIVDEAALTDALKQGRIAGAALDVYAEQPLKREHPFFGLDNVLLTPHVAGITAESMRRMSIGACEETVRLLRGEKPVNLVNPAVWDKFLARRRG
jgi:D-3-phosphoglycerate dehydrogenase / 2-oxoglutarate reductase